jgi:hypothetical protein
VFANDWVAEEDRPNIHKNTNTSDLAIRLKQPITSFSM